jgi:hypothetical protein
MNTDRVLAWVGVAIGILGLIPIFRDASLQLAIAYTIVLALLLILFAFLYRSGRGPQYATLSMKKTLRIVETDGSLARMSREQRIRVNYGQLSEIWCRNIVADGSIQNLLIDKSPPDDEKRMGCLLSICKRFSTPLFRGQEATILWTHELLNAFPAINERMEHDVTPETLYLELIVELPNSRPCRAATLHESVSGEPARLLPDPTIELHGTVLKAVVKRPREGRTICLSWEW